MKTENPSVSLNKFHHAQYEQPGKMKRKSNEITGKTRKREHNFSMRRIIQKESDIVTSGQDQARYS